MEVDILGKFTILWNWNDRDSSVLPSRAYKGHLVEENEGIGLRGGVPVHGWIDNSIGTFDLGYVHDRFQPCTLLMPIGGVIYSWGSPRTVTLLGFGTFCLLAFVLYSKVFVQNPLIRGSIFHTATSCVNYIGAIIHGIIVWSTLYYMPIYLQVAKGKSPIQVAMALFAFTLTQGVLAIMVSFAIANTGYYRSLLVS